MATKTDKLTPKQQAAIRCLLSEPSIAKAATVAGVGQRTLHRWLDEADFASAYQSARRQAVQQAISRLQQTSGAAVTILLSIAADAKAPASSRVAAASKVLELAIKTVELEEIEARLAALEATMKEKR